MDAVGAGDGSALGVIDGAMEIVVVSVGSTASATLVQVTANSIRNTQHFCENCIDIACNLSELYSIVST